MNVVVDATVLLYAVGSEPGLREPCRQLLVAHGRGLVAAMTTVEVIQRFVYARARRRDQHDATALGWHYMDALDVMVQEVRDLDLGLTLFDRYPGLGMANSVLAAVALNRKADALVSADRAFTSIPNLVCLHPIGHAFDLLLEGRLT